MQFKVIRQQAKNASALALADTFSARFGSKIETIERFRYIQYMHGKNINKNSGRRTRFHSSRNTPNVVNI